MSTLTFGAALLLGLAASGHCVLMCGGISSALALATEKSVSGKPRPELLVGYQLGRVMSYALAGCLFAGTLGALIAVLDIEAVRRALRLLASAALLLGACVAFGYVRSFDYGFGRRMLPALAKIGRHLLPVTSLPRAIAFGMLWGWMPCGFVYTVLLIATLQGDALNGAMTMAAFGAGTAPAVLATAFGAARLSGIAFTQVPRRVAGSLLLTSALLTAAAPWLLQTSPGLHQWLPFDCFAAY